MAKSWLQITFLAFLLLLVTHCTSPSTVSAAINVRGWPCKTVEDCYNNVYCPDPPVQCIDNLCQCIPNMISPNT
ncbi:hypothetical protein Tsubulata_031167 [Turnera subulata]|uniref:Bifunctional inhibitor/plant lipid transfer protein/seed storage helical domain-containing protein n=1 Tax=Turnera subulata TaxID=218843 RepID=A0A9Q0FG16_9ROSI|nr:hypothetical protein Tsubulata_031167 [Turnera subulata]